MIARNSYGHACRPGVLAVSPTDDIEMPDEYIDQARAELRADNMWISEQIADATDEFLAELLMSDAPNDAERDVMSCQRLRAAVNAAIDREAPDLAEKMWMSDIDSSQRAAADYAADCRDNDY